MSKLSKHLVFRFTFKCHRFCMPTRHLSITLHSLYDNYIESAGLGALPARHSTIDTSNVSFHSNSILMVSGQYKLTSNHRCVESGFVLSSTSVKWKEKKGGEAIRHSVPLVTGLIRNCVTSQRSMCASQWLLWYETKERKINHIPKTETLLIIFKILKELLRSFDISWILTCSYFNNLLYNVNSTITRPLVRSRKMIRL